MTDYIATDRGGRDQWLAIYGIGETPDAAIEDARDGAGPDAEFDTLPASPALVAQVRERGGAPRDVWWTVVRGTAVLDAEADSYALHYAPKPPSGSAPAPPRKRSTPRRRQAGTD
jgi:hypothetical protein